MPSFTTFTPLSLLLLLPASILALPSPQSGPVAPAWLIPTTAANITYDLTCPRLGPRVQPGTPYACEAAIMKGIKDLPSELEFSAKLGETKGHSSTVTKPFPLTISSADYPSRKTVSFSGSGNGTDPTDAICTVKFSFSDDASADHAETWSRADLRLFATLAWGKCMVRPDSEDGEDIGATAVIVPKPKSDSQGKLQIEIQSVSNVQEVVATS